MLARYKPLIFGVILIAIAGGMVALLTYRPPPTIITINPPPPTATTRPSVTPGPLHVYMTGGVVNPFTMYNLPPGSRVSDAIDAAGGFSPNADRARINLAQAVTDGQQINVPVVAAQNVPVTAPSSSTNPQVAPTTGTTPISTVAIATVAAAANIAPSAVDTTTSSDNTAATDSPTFDPVHINTATLADLQRLPSVGPSTAQAIIDYRTKNGPFKSMDDLGKVPRIGPKTLAKWADKIIFD